MDKEKKNPCLKCRPQGSECDFCPHSSSGRLNLELRGYK